MSSRAQLDPGIKRLRRLLHPARSKTTNWRMKVALQIETYFELGARDIEVTGSGCKPLLRLGFPVASTSLPV
jgi:hypothetical protein